MLKERVTAVLTKSSKGAIVRVKYWTPSQRQLKEYKRIHPEDPDGCDYCMLACTNVQSVRNCTMNIPSGKRGAPASLFTRMESVTNVMLCHAPINTMQYKYIFLSPKCFLILKDEDTNIYTDKIRKPFVVSNTA